MPVNVLAPFGLRPVANRIGAAPTFQANKYKIQRAYATAIGFGDVVYTGVGAAQGYVTLAADGAARVLGVFAGCLPFYASSLQQVVNYAYWPSGGLTTPAGVDIDCLVYDDQNAVFQAQVDGGPWAESWRGRNIGWLAGTNGVPGSDAMGVSTLLLDAATIDVSNTLPFKILGLAQTASGGPQDPENENPVIEVALNTAELASSTGI